MRPLAVISAVIFLVGLVSAQDSVPPAPQASKTQEETTTQPAEEKTFRPLTIEEPQFLPDKVGLIHLECERLATFLALYTNNELADKVAAKDAAARVQARRNLSLALHLDPDNIAAKRIHELLVNGQPHVPEIQLPQEPEAFVLSVAALNKRLKASTLPAAERLAGFLALLAADLDPTNEDVVYDAEIFARSLGDVVQAWKELATGMKPTPVSGEKVTADEDQGREEKAAGER